jgi:hypothetical protein
MRIFVLVAVLALAAANAVASQPATLPSAGPFPAVCTDKVSATPHFYQRDPRWNLEIAGDMFCVPASVSDSFVYFAANGYGGLLPIDPQKLTTENSDREYAQAELVEKLASASYMNTKSEPGTGTTPSEALFGIRRYVDESGYACKRLEYAGWRQLTTRFRSAAVAPSVDLNWVRSAIADPNGAAWFQIGFYTHGAGPGQWKRQSGHMVVAVGYGTDGTHVDPNIFLVDNPSMSGMSAAAQASGKVRPITLADLVLTFTPLGEVQITSDQITTPRTVDGLYQISGPGVMYSHKKYDAVFLDGAIVLVIGKKP